MKSPITNNPAVLRWVEEMAALCQPDQIVWCDGSEDEKERLTEEAVAQGILIKLNQKKLPGCYYHRSEPERRRPRRAVHVHLHREPGRSRPDQQLDGAQGDVPEAARPLPPARCAAARCTSCPT